MVRNEKKGMVLNLTEEYLILPKELNCFEKIIVLPDYSPNNGMPVGCVAVFDRASHKIKHNYLGMDIGCGMLAASIRKVDMTSKVLEECTDKIAKELLSRNDNSLGTIGRGNHFITLYKVTESNGRTVQQNDYVVLIHSGSRDKGIQFYDLKLQVEKYFQHQELVLDYAKRNRRLLLELVANTFNCETEIVLDQPHNYIEDSGTAIIYRRGNVKLLPGEITMIPSSMAGEAVIVAAGSTVSEIEYAIPHGTGRNISRSTAKTEQFYLQGLPDNIYIPPFLTSKRLNQELPQNYRTLEDVLSKISRYVSIEARLTPISSIML